MRRILSTITLFAALVLSAVFIHAQRPLEIYYIDAEGGGGTLFVSPSGESLLVALEQHGLKPPSGCRMGICNTCACGKSAGSARHLPSGELIHEPTQALKLCIHSAATDLELDL